MSILFCVELDFLHLDDRTYSNCVGAISEGWQVLARREKTEFGEIDATKEMSQTETDRV
jgi:hypothetical protein